MVTEECCTCGVLFALQEGYIRVRKKDHQYFYCPNGHPQNWPQDTPEQLQIKKLREQLDAAAQLERRLVDRQSRLENDLMDAAKETKRVRRRHHAGTCPHCKRTFADMARHIAKQHPAEHNAVLLK